jgi:hypothetical protein
MSTPAKTSALLAKLVGLNRECLEITRRAVLAAEEGDQRAVDDLVAQRGRLLTRISLLDDNLPVETSGDERVLVCESDAERDAAAQWLDQWEQIASALGRADRELTVRLERDRDAVRRDLNRASQGRTMLKGYHSGRPKPAPRLIRRKS